ncbi:hypothetical protein BpHYR1_006251 [Brachionus plicatilis]|uniref:Uncharacterized protein n=1 Tax=Brachionus plicatilis TaxID=10195 RepID=A0A3M7RAL6_BRAPC|nr:hypothetical protein BpHYR1_006251 [Brachionus plicatilis]
MNSHKRQSSTGSFNIDQNAFQTSFSNLENFMILTKLMQDEIMVPCKLKDKTFSSLTSLSTSNSNHEQDEQLNSDVLDHYKFLLMIRNQFLQVNPFKNDDECLKNKQFKTIFDNLKYHYTELMTTLDSLSNDAKGITDIYKENV